MKVFMWRMKAQEIRDEIRDMSPDGLGHGITDIDLNEAFSAADDLAEAMRTIESKLEDNEP